MQTFTKVKKVRLATVLQQNRIPVQNSKNLAKSHDTDTQIGKPEIQRARDDVYLHPSLPPLLLLLLLLLFPYLYPPLVASKKISTASIDKAGFQSDILTTCRTMTISAPHQTLLVSKMTPLHHLPQTHSSLLQHTARIQLKVLRRMHRARAECQGRH